MDFSNIHQRFPEFAAEVGNKTKAKFIGVELLLFRGLMVVHPDSVKFVLKNEDLFPKARGPTPSKVAKLLSKNVLNANGDEWK
jgi:cytochrome P450